MLIATGPAAGLPLLTPEQQEAVLAWHEARGYECNAHSESQNCCIDLWLEGGPP